MLMRVIDWVLDGLFMIVFLVMVVMATLLMGA
jgi:hypothetical protein